MTIKSLQIGLLGLFLCVASAWAGDSSVQGTVTDPAGQPVNGAEIRVEPRNGGNVVATTKTDANGRFVASDLQPGTYRVTLLVNGVVQSSINNTKTKAATATRLNFQLASAGAAKSVAAKKGKRLVWVPANTGSHVGGRWVEVEEGGAAAAGALNVGTINSQQLERQIHSSDAKPMGR
ncbi:MAG: carboxypeptidase-like regulatory domain-containing protein [Chthoniobacterales bacterium]